MLWNFDLLSQFPNSSNACTLYLYTFRTWQTIQTQRLMASVLKLAVLVVSVTAVLVRHSPLRVCPRRTPQKPQGRRESYRDGWTEKPSLSCPRKWGPTACFVRTKHCGPVYIRFQPLHALVMVLYKIKLWFTDRLVSLFLSGILVIMPSYSDTQRRS